MCFPMWKTWFVEKTASIEANAGRCIRAPKLHPVRSSAPLPAVGGTPFNHIGRPGQGCVLVNAPSQPCVQYRRQSTETRFRISAQSASLHHPLLALIYWRVLRLPR